MKKLLFVTAFSLAVGGAVTAQNTTPDARLLKKYTQEQLTQIQKNNPEEIAYLNYCADHAYYLAPMPSEKGGAKELKGTLTIADVNNINFFELGLNIVEDDYQYYRINGSDKMLVVRSKEHIIKEMNK